MAQKLTEDMKRKISLGMKRAHAKKKQWKTGGGTPGLLQQLEAERKEITAVIDYLKRRGV